MKYLINRSFPIHSAQFRLHWLWIRNFTVVNVEDLAWFRHFGLTFLNHSSFYSAFSFIIIILYIYLLNCFLVIVWFYKAYSLILIVKYGVIILQKLVTYDPFTCIFCFAFVIHKVHLVRWWNQKSIKCRGLIILV